MAGGSSAGVPGSSQDSPRASLAQKVMPGASAREPRPSRKPSRAVFLCIPALPFLLLAAAICLVYVNYVDLPSPAPPTLPPTVFSEGRVQSFLNALTSGVRTLGSCNNELFAPLLMLRFVKEELLGFRPLSAQPGAGPAATRTSDPEKASDTPAASRSVEPVVVHSFSYYLQATYGPPATFPAVAANRKPPSHAEGALPRVYPPALLSPLTLCSVPLELSTPSFSGAENLPTDLRARLSKIEVPHCASLTHSRRVCEGEHGSEPGENARKRTDPSDSGVATPDAETLHPDGRISAAALRAFVEGAVDAYDAALHTRLLSSFQDGSNVDLADSPELRGALFPPTTVPAPAASLRAESASSSVWWPGTPQLRTRCFKVTRYLLASAVGAKILGDGTGRATEEALKHLLVVDVSSSSAFAGGTFFKWNDGRHALYSGLYNLALRIQPFSVLETNRTSAQNALLLSAHADSASGSPGGSDDAAMVGTLLEVARNAVYIHLASVEKTLNAAREQGSERAEAEGHDQKLWTLDAPVIVDINGAEEVGLLGAHGFAMLHPFARQVAYAVNLEAAGRGGKEMLVQTTGTHGTRLVAHYKSISASPHASSLAMDVGDMGLFPGETDLRVWRDVLHVKGGIEFAWTSDGFFYHTKYDDVHRMRPGAIQRVGDLVLPLAQKLTADLAAQREKGDVAADKAEAGAHGSDDNGDAGVLEGKRGDAHVLPGNAQAGGGAGCTAGNSAASLWGQTLPETSWPRSSSFFADVLGTFLFVFPLRYFEVLLVLLGLLLRMQVRLEAQVLGLRFSLPLLLLAVGSFLLALIAPLALAAVASQLLALLSLPLLTFWDWRLGAALFGTLGTAAFFAAWHRLMFARLFRRFPATRHPFKAEQAALHGAIAVSLLLLAVLRYSGARAAFVPLALVLLSSGSRVLVLLFLKNQRSFSASRGSPPENRGTEDSLKLRERGPGEKMWILTAAHCAALVLPTVAILQMTTTLANTFAAVLGRVHSVWGLGDSFGFTVSVFPLLLVLFPLLVWPSLFFAMHHADASREAVSAHHAHPGRRRARQSVLSLWMVLTAVGFALVAVGVVFFHTNPPEEPLRGGAQDPRPGVYTPETRRQTAELNMWQAVQNRLGQVVSIFLRSRNEDILFPFSKETPLRLDVRLFSRKRVRGFTAKGRMELEKTEGGTDEEVGILLRGVSPSGHVLDPTSHATGRTLDAVYGALSAVLRRGGEKKDENVQESDRDERVWPELVAEKFVHFEGMSPEDTQKVMLRFPQIPVAQNKGHAIAIFLSSGDKDRKDQADAPAAASPRMLLPPHPIHSKTSGKGPTVPSSIFLHPTSAFFSSRYDPSTDRTHCRIRIGGSSLFFLLLPASPIVGWSLDKTMSLEKIRGCDCLVLTVFAPHPPVLADFSLTLKGKSGLTFSSTSSLMDPLEPVSSCREASLFGVAASVSAFSPSTRPPEEHRLASADRRQHRKDKQRDHSDGKVEGTAHVAFWEELERRLPGYVVGTYYVAEHIQWEVPPPPFEGSFFAAGRDSD
ncbi:Peptidase, M20/M25/M40 family protein, related [Neospora caninum Liverpool]|uniref:Peptidase, M20/M25/M40 family protein, related n=1 Tax=Neospora caninum (strain Liverpool) TaxID=572307 RepID=F0VLY8_NEOCL|nr:Peptidase, M20/M25/M40 family protein, related [Neospora caninum Liverpool]CBZ54266.1 Peptidase, M20/M25/M40 family protein, related [Neospora caninum Liverpool]CEL68971.1 TPA: Peptidase, M20/M25/M40 family protein, related [Neospora caninum Liverpool]|eukprot:XP_003884297.1 Peptidase, M20/M25/M40 family protein, related [Neospora caninum Liverpool]